ncbi:MAG TPA: hypothetical protein VLF40_03205 [Candidatus Saccharimonadales bacterium]|nr:hypothetical protein [Candidatus Saccharimonadales bacterium]
MDFTNPSRGHTPGRSPQPSPQRRVFNDFGAPRPDQPPKLHQPTASLKPPAPFSAAAPLPKPPSKPQPAFRPPQPTPPKPTELNDFDVPRPYAMPAERGHKEEHHVHSENAHAGIVGLVVFGILAALTLSPFIPGKTFVSFPGISQTTASGQQTLACLTALGPVTTTDAYGLRLGTPITYKYSVTTTQKAACEGQEQTAVIAETGQFNPLGLLINLASAFVLAVVVAKIWALIFRSRV